MNTSQRFRAPSSAKWGLARRPFSPRLSLRRAVSRHLLLPTLCAALALPGLPLPPAKSAAAARRPAVAAAQTAGSTSAEQSAAAGVEHLKRVMDQYHDRFIVSEDVSSPGNHFHSWAKIPNDQAAVEANGSWADRPHSGATAIRCKFSNVTGSNFGGFYFLNGVLPPGAQAPVPNWGTYLDAGVDLTGATALTFWARGERGGETVEFFMGGIGRHPVWGWVNQPCTPDFAAPCPAADSTPVVKITVTLSDRWQPYCIDLRGKNLSYVLGGFGWVASAVKNPNGAVFYLDDIQYELSPERRAARLNEPRLLRSFTMLPVQPDPFDANKDDDLDFVLRNTAFVYDNALALLAFLADGTDDGLRRARLIGDAFVYASQHDRTFDDGRLRSSYAAGDIAVPPGWLSNGRRATAPVPGFYVERGEQREFVEVGQENIDVGNNAWAMIALLALHQRTQAAAYLQTAEKLGQFIRTFRNNSGRYQGFQGGLENPESSAPKRRAWASSEHNLDVYAAFTRMFRITRNPQWLADAHHARRLVDDMWDEQKGCYLSGTTDPEHRYDVPFHIPVDVQAWAVLVLPDALQLHPKVLEGAERHHRLTHHGFAGYDFNDNKDGVWFEGTAHMATAYAWAGQETTAESIRQELRRAQQTEPFGDGRGLAAACHDGVSTEFEFDLFRRLHVGATAWHVFAQLRFNPYYQEVPNPSSQGVMWRAVSRGALAQEYPFQYGFAKFYRNDELFHFKTGGSGGGRGFNIAAIDPTTSQLIEPVKIFDIWGQGCPKANEMISYLNGLPNGTLLLMAAADETGLNVSDSCQRSSLACIEPLIKALESLGSKTIRAYCYRHSWAMITVKGAGEACSEALGNAVEATAKVTLNHATACPTVSGLSPASGPVGTSVQINGANFTGVNAVRFAGNVSASFTVNSATQITAIVPAGAATGPITISKPGCPDARTNSFAVTACGYTAGLPEQFFTESGGTGSIGVRATPGCAWAATSDAAWLTLLPPSSGSGSGSFEYFGFKVAANLGPSRVATVTVAGQTVTVFQAASCRLPLARRGDFDGDGRADPAVWRGPEGNWFVRRSSDDAPRVHNWGLSLSPYLDVPVAADYDGDGKADVAVWRPGAGAWYIVNSADSSVRVEQWGAGGDTPVPADYDGDGRADLAVWRGATGWWFIRRSSDGGQTTHNWGLSVAPYRDIPQPGDYDGDGKADLAVWRPLDGVWYVVRSSDSATRAAAWGANGDTPVAADYDGDGKADLAVWRGATGDWHVMRSSEGAPQVRNWGLQSAPYHDTPVPADYDGDGKDDLAVWRPLDGVWYVIRSSDAAARTVGWGTGGDTPVCVLR